MASTIYVPHLQQFTACSLGKYGYEGIRTGRTSALCCYSRVHDFLTTLCSCGRSSRFVARPGANLLSLEVLYKNNRNLAGILGSQILDLREQQRCTICPRARPRERAALLKRVPPNYRGRRSSTAQRWWVQRDHWSRPDVTPCRSEDVTASVTERKDAGFSDAPSNISWKREDSRGRLRPRFTTTEDATNFTSWSRYPQSRPGQKPIPSSVCIPCSRVSGGRFTALREPRNASSRRGEDQAHEPATESSENRAVNSAVCVLGVEKKKRPT